MSTIEGGNEVAAELTAMGVRAGAAAFAVTRYHGQMLEAAVKRRASLPRTAPRGPNTGGPRLITGSYLRSINLRMSPGLGGPTASVGTNAPQARRLELGFVGVDSAGRSYNAPPYPHFAPALDEVEPLFVAAIAAIAAS